MAKVSSKRILIVSGVFPPEPVTSAYLNYDLAVELSKSYDVTVLRPFPSRPAGLDYSYFKGLSNLPFKCVTLNSYRCPESSYIGRMRESFSFGRACKKFLLSHKGEFSYIYNASWHLFGYKIVSRTAVEQGIPYMVPIQDIYPESLYTGKNFPWLLRGLLNIFLKPIDRYYLSHAHKIRTITMEMSDYLSKTRNIQKDKFLIVNNWQDESLLQYEKPVIHEKMTFSYVGSINNHSNTELIIKAFAKANIKNARLMIYGKGNRYESCVRLVESQGLSDRIVFDSVSKQKVSEVQANADFLVLALPEGNAHFSLPSKITSYMLSGRPIIASVDVDSASARIIKEAGAGYSVIPDNMSAFAEMFKRVSVLSYDEIERIGLNGRLYAQEYLSKKVNLSLVVNVINNCVGV